MLNSDAEIGSVAFLGASIQYSKAVLTPRLETEALVLGVLQRVHHDTIHCIVDIGTGSGAIIISMAKRMPKAGAIAIDISPAALLLAQKNAENNQIECEFLLGDLFAPLWMSFKGQNLLCMANLPYIWELESLPEDVLENDPPLALYGGITGFELILRFLEASLSFRTQCASLQIGLEIGHEQMHLLRDWTNLHGIHLENWNDYSWVTRFALLRYENPT